MGDEHADVLRETLAWFVRELMEAEVTQQIGAGLRGKNPERTAQRKGCRERAWQTRAGEIALAIPRLRAGNCFPSVVEPLSRSEKALVAVVQEACVNGVSTRKVERLVTQLGLSGMSKSAVSCLCAGLDEQVGFCRERPLEGRYPYLWLDAKVERVREPGGGRRKTLVVAYGVHETGRREVIGSDVGEAETEAFWREFLRSLRARGLSGVQLCVSDAHEGLKNDSSKRRSTNSFERVNREVGRRTTVVGIYPNHTALLRLAAALLIEQNDEWLVSGRYFSEESFEAVLAMPADVAGVVGVGALPAA
jgi:putative transposase